MTYIALPFTDKEPNTFRPGTAKRLIFDWCLRAKEFTKDDFLSFIKEQLALETFKSKMDPDTCSKAWFSELKNKAKCIGEKPDEPAQEEQAS